jgi:hypothetical protein
MGGSGAGSSGSGAGAGVAGVGCDAGCGAVMREGGEWPIAGCTEGANQTCNENPAMSSYSGVCLPGGKCSCNNGFAIKLATGRCVAFAAPPNAPCVRDTGGCNDNPIAAARLGLCLPDGSCYCIAPALKNPATGLCKMQ